MISKINKQALESVVETSLRFPLSIISCTFSWIFSVLLIDTQMDSALRPFGDSHQSFMYLLSRLVLVGVLGFFVFTSTKLSYEKQKYSKYWLYLLYFVETLGIFGYFFLYWPANQYDLTATHLINVIVLILVLIIVNFLAPFVSKYEQIHFWSFSYKAIERFIITMVFSGVICLGSLIAIGASDTLMGTNFKIGTLFLLIITTVGFVFAPIFFLAGVPKVFDRELKYPKILAIFSNYIVLGFVLVYMVILYAYAFKSVVIWNWPEGGVVYTLLVLIFPTLIYHLLTYPIKNRFNNRELGRILNRGLFVALLPVLLIYFCAIFFRINSYGLTVSRSIVVVFGIWVTLVCLYYLFSKKQALSFIPISFVVLAVITTFSPINMFSVSQKNQLSRLTRVLEKNSMLFEGKLKKSTGNVSFEDSKEITSIISYLYNTHGFDSLAHLLTEAQLARVSSGTFGSRQLIEMIGIEYTPDYATESSQQNKWWEARVQKGASRQLDIGGYEYLFEVWYTNYSGGHEMWNGTNNTGMLLRNEQEGNLFIFFDTQKKLNISFNQQKILQVDLLNLLAEHYEESKGLQVMSDDTLILPDYIKLTGESDEIDIRLVIEEITGYATGNSPNSITTFDGFLLVRYK